MRPPSRGQARPTVKQHDNPPPGNAGDCVVSVATDVFFNFGAPALLLDPAGSGAARLRDVSVFVGPAPETKETVMIEPDRRLPG